MQEALLHTAQYIVNTAGPYGGVTPLKLQKLLYYVKAWGLVEGMELVPGQFEKWPHGPVEPTVYHAFKGYGRHFVEWRDVPPAFEPRGRTREVIDFILYSYVPFGAVTLSTMTHREAPWRETEAGAVISEARMRTYYGLEHPFHINFPVDPSREYVAVSSDASTAFTLDMTEEDRRSARTFGSFGAYRAHLDRIRRAQPGFDDVFNRLLT